VRLYKNFGTNYSTNGADVKCMLDVSRQNSREDVNRNRGAQSLWVGVYLLMSGFNKTKNIFTSYTTTRFSVCTLFHMTHVVLNEGFLGFP
jgi:hypothetical protein